ncbi:MAG TPA: hypothetical protein PLJ35_05690 [Anaerolineae bacterium]|nr:hypothetical protein [Anaerolineae bacterium]HOQ98295.1 hypothetical protein [Anaerolineae bacterium]HPL28566.1 hypothetical protein [Anaerolineae bacterium]
MASPDEHDLAVPPDLALRYEWRAASMPPPSHYEYAISIGPGAQGEIAFLPDYAQHDPPVWREHVAVTGEALAGLYAVLRRVAVFSRPWRRAARPPIGDSHDWLDVTAGGTTVRVPSHLDAKCEAAIEPVYEAVRALVPQEVWARLMAQREAFIQAY